MNPIKEKILESGYKQSWIAEQLGVHFTEISQWVAGRRFPNRERRKALAKLLKCKMAEISREEYND